MRSRQYHKDTRDCGRGNSSGNRPILMKREIYSRLYRNLQLARGLMNTDCGPNPGNLIVHKHY